MNRAPFAPDEWYHCYSRGVDKRTTFESREEYQRFTELLYLCNSAKPIHRSDLFNKTNSQTFTLPRGEPLVSVGAYCLMPNHFHLLLKNETESGDGISRFMQKVGTAYTMYFNASRERTGNLFVKPFRSKHIPDDRYLKRIVQYIHFNPIELIEPKWKEGKLEKPRELKERLLEYPFNSLLDYETESFRPEATILAKQSRALLRSDSLPLKDALIDTRLYYESLA